MMDEAGMPLLVEPVSVGRITFSQSARSFVDWSSYGKPPRNPPPTAQEDAARPDWHQRVIDEKAELDARIGKLCAFLQSDAYRALPDVDQRLLDRQLSHMRDYAHILFMRVARFG